MASQQRGLSATPVYGALLRYGLVAYAFTWILAAPNVMAARGWADWEVQHWIEPIAAFGPFVAALLLARRLGRSPADILRGLGHWRVGAGPFILATLSPVVLLALAAVGVVLAGGDLVEAGRDRLGTLTTLAGIVDLVLVGAVIQALGEEPGWRGLMLPALRQRHGPLIASLLLFPVWLFWHLPFFLSRPEFGLAQWLGFSAGILSASIWLTMIWDSTRSVLMAVLWHAVVNICRGIALAMSSALFLAISNAVLLGALCICAYWAWRRRRRPGDQEAAN